jgi:succinate dehydrogenase / fumarate reductase cytochrome b subunit
MPRIAQALRSTLGGKYVTSVTGAALAIFVLFHFAANLALFLPDPTAYNLMSNSLVAWGKWLVVAEVVLLVLLVIHILVAVRLKLLARRARPYGYSAVRSKGGPSHEGFSSARLLLTGTIILVFIAVHVAQFKFGPGIHEGYATPAGGLVIRDLHRLVLETFRDPRWAAFYAVCMIFLGFHLRHGLWSLFQSLGATNRRTLGPLQAIGAILAVIIAAGFALMPVFICLGGGSGGISR